MGKTLSKVNLELKELHSEKDKLFSVIAHDLRSPVSTLMSLLKISETNKMDVQKYDVLLKDISDRVGDTYELLNNLLQWAKNQMKGIVPDPVYFDLQENVKLVIDSLLDIAGAKKLFIRRHIEKQRVFADKDMFAVILRNLTMNAIKYSTEGSEITIASEIKDKMIVISIKDTGIGMSEEVQKKLFKLSETKSHRGTNNEAGIGLGLVLCADFVKLNGGEIWCASKEDEGSTFYFTVPS
jgi:signal transduction histidine kinase